MQVLWRNHSWSVEMKGKTRRLIMVLGWLLLGGGSPNFFTRRNLGTISGCWLGHLSSL